MKREQYGSVWKLKQLFVFPIFVLRNGASEKITLGHCNNCQSVFVHPNWYLPGFIYKKNEIDFSCNR